MEGTMRVLQAITILSVIFIFSVAAFGAEVMYIPPYATVSVAPGESETVEFNAIMPDGGGMYFVQFAQAVQGDIPPILIDVNPPFTWNLPATFNVTVKVPPGTAPDTYSATLISGGMGGGHQSNNQSIMLYVVVPSECGEVPSFKITSIGPDNLWAPNNSMQEVTLRGRVDMPKGCTIYEASYTIDDEYGECSGEGSFTIDSDGEFIVSIPVEASRKGNDKDGRLYTIVLSAENDSGVGMSQAIDVHVAHNQRK